MVSVGLLKGKVADIKGNREARRYFHVVVICVVAMIALGVFLVIGGISSIAKERSGVTAGEIVEGTALSTERNAAGGLIVDINYNQIVGYDANKNPIYASNGHLPAVMGYDMCGTPVNAEGLVVTEIAADSLPIYGNVSSIDAARKRGLAAHGESSANWNSIVGYGQDNNPIFAANIRDSAILGYDLLGMAVEKGAVIEVGRTQSGMPIYDFTVIMKAKMIGTQEQERIMAERSLENIMSNETEKNPQ